MDLTPEERVAVKQVGSRSKAHFTGLWLEGPINTLMDRIAKRKKDASDATADVVSAQAKQPTGAVDWLRVDASSPVESIVSCAFPQYWVDRRWPRSVSKEAATTPPQSINSVMADLKPFCRNSAQTRH